MYSYTYDGVWSSCDSFEEKCNFFIILLVLNGLFKVYTYRSLLLINKWVLEDSKFLLLDKGGGEGGKIFLTSPLLPSLPSLPFYPIPIYSFYFYPSYTLLSFLFPLLCVFMLIYLLRIFTHLLTIFRAVFIESHVWLIYLNSSPFSPKNIIKLSSYPLSQHLNTSP